MSSDYPKPHRKLSDRAFSEPLIQYEKKNEDEQYIDLFGTRTRFVVMVLVLMCLTSIWSNILSFNFAIICMAPKGGNSTMDEEDSYTFSKSDSSWITSVVALGALVANFPVVSVVNQFGTRLVFSMLGIVSAVATVALPWAIRSGFSWILVMRALQGMSFAGNFTVIGAFCSRWTYFKQTGLFVAILVSYVQLSPAITMPVSGILCSAFSWSSVFYAHGLTTMILFIVYGLFYRNSPQKHPFVGPLESRKISTGKAVETKKAVAPYAQILSTPAVWAVWAAAIGNFTAVNLMFLYSPTYLSAVLGLSTNSTGITAALPPFTQFLVKLICGVVSDRIHCLSERGKFRLFNSIAFGGSACCFLLLACMGTETKTLNMLLLGGAAGILGCSTGGFYKAGPVISKQYSYFVTGNISLMLTLTMIVVPFMVSVLTPNNTQDEWRWVFVITAVVQLLSNLIFCVFIRGEPCEWTREKEKELVDVKREKNSLP